MILLLIGIIILAVVALGLAYVGWVEEQKIKESEKRK